MQIYAYIYLPNCRLLAGGGVGATKVPMMNPLNMAIMNMIKMTNEFWNNGESVKDCLLYDLFRNG